MCQRKKIMNVMIEEELFFKHQKELGQATLKVSGSQ